MKNLAEVVFILDRSGSMHGLESDTIGGFNSMLEKQKRNDGEALVSTILFDNDSRVIHNRVPIKEVKPMTRKDYRVKGCTALLDAVGNAISHIVNMHKNMSDDLRPTSTLFVIITDGMENASTKYSYTKVKNMIKKQQEKYSWEFIFLGANIDAIKVADRIGIHKNRAANYHADSIGTKKNFEAVSLAVDCCLCACEIPVHWKDDIDEDYKNRKDELPPWYR